VQRQARFICILELLFFRSLFYSFIKGQKAKLAKSVSSENMDCTRSMITSARISKIKDISDQTGICAGINLLAYGVQNRVFNKFSGSFLHSVIIFARLALAWLRFSFI
jgi:hypothetical protein